MRKRELKGFLIRRFLVVMAGIAAASIGIDMLYSNLLLPFLKENLGNSLFQGISEDAYGAGTLISLILWLVVEGILELFPNWVSQSANQFIMRYISSDIGGVWNYLQNPEYDILSLRHIGSLLILLLLVALAVLPYVVGAVVYSRLIREEIREILEEDKKKHREYEKNRNRMLSDIAHDLKTPITTISGYAQALCDGMITAPDRQKQYLEAIYNKSNRMCDLISVLFEYVKIDSEGFTLQKKYMDVVEVFRENIALFYSDYERKGIEVVIDLPEERILYPIDKIQFSRALANLLSNALRHVDAGERITLRLLWEEEAEQIWIVIGDSGRQIEDEVAKRIFEPFVMGDVSRNSRGGSGLGLSIASKIIRMHGGELYLDRNSTEEYTKAFIITLTE